LLTGRLTSLPDPVSSSYRRPPHQFPTQIATAPVVTAPELFGRLKALPLIETFLSAHPAASARVLLFNRVIDLGEEGVDVAIRLTALPDSRLAAVRLGEVRRLICAAPAYLDRKGRPAHPSDLDTHESIGHNEAGERELWPFRLPGRARHRVRSFPIRSRLTLNSTGAARDAAMRGHGVCRLLSYQVADLLADRILEPLLTQFEPAPVPVNLVFQTRPRRDGIVRAFVDHMGPLLRAELERIAGIVSARRRPHRAAESRRRSLPSHADADQVVRRQPGSTSPSTSLSRNAGAYRSSPSPRSYATTSMR
jgi:DNA-binding transcriptional LysR family regulator